VCVDKLKVSTFLVISLLIVRFILVLIIVSTSMVVFAYRHYGCYRRQRITDGTDCYSGHQGSGKYTVQLHALIAYGLSEAQSYIFFYRNVLY
jgi:hypothetical protein